MRYAVGCDHAGLDLKECLVAELERQGHEVQYLGTHRSGSVDYPVYALRVARAVKDGAADAGLLLCGTGVGMSMTANKVPGIRAASVSEPFSAAMARRHNNANVLCLGARVIEAEAAVEILRAWLGEEFEGGRHQRRLDMIREAECA